MPARTLQLRGLVNVSRSCHLHNLDRSLLHRCTAHQIRSFSLESLTTPFNRKELRAAASGTPDLSSQYHLVYVGTLARRIATYKIGAFILSACGLAVAPIVVATAQVPLMALPGCLPTQYLIDRLVALISSLPLVGYHYLTRRYVLSMHVYIPPTARNNLQAFNAYLNSMSPDTIVRFRTFRLIFGIKPTIVPIEELQLVSVPGRIQAFEKNVEWNSTSLRSRTWFGGKKAWYVQPGLGGHEMDLFWSRLGMDNDTVNTNRKNAVKKMREMGAKKVEGMKAAVEKYEGTKTEESQAQKKEVAEKSRPKKVKRISLK